MCKYVCVHIHLYICVYVIPPPPPPAEAAGVSVTPAAPAGGGGRGNISPKNSNLYSKNHFFEKNIRYYQNLDELADNTYVLMYERIILSFNFSNKIISRNVKKLCDNEYHNVIKYNINDLDYRIVNGEKFNKVFDTTILTDKSMRYESYKVKRYFKEEVMHVRCYIDILLFQKVEYPILI